jgi:hypothetical protein
MNIGDLRLSDVGQRIRIDLDEGDSITAKLDGIQMAAWLSSVPHSAATLSLKSGAWSTHQSYPLTTPCELLPDEPGELDYAIERRP